MSVHLARLVAWLNRGALPPLVLMTDDVRLPDPVAAAKQLPRRSMIVVRAKENDRRRALAVALTAVARRRDLFLLVAGDAALAAEVAADGVHFPEAQMSRLSRWRALRPGWFLTTSAHSPRAVTRARLLGADAVFVSPIFATQSHPGRHAWGPLQLRIVARAAALPIYALGGITCQTILRLRDADIAGVAAVGALAATIRESASAETRPSTAGFPNR